MWSAATEHDGAGLMAMVLGSARSALETLRHKLARNRLRVLEADFWPRIAPIACDSVHSCHGDRAALIYAFVTFVPNPMGQSKMAAVSRLADFSSDRYLLFAPVSTHLGRRCATLVLTAGSQKS